MILPLMILPFHPSFSSFACVKSVVESLVSTLLPATFLAPLCLCASVVSFLFLSSGPCC